MNSECLGENKENIVNNIEIGVLGKGENPLELLFNGYLESKEEPDEYLIKIKQEIGTTNEEGNGEEESMLLRDVFNNLGQEETLNPQQELSGFGFNDSQFQGIGDNSQYNDVLEISAFERQTIMDKFGDYDIPKDSILQKRNRLSSEIVDPERNGKDGRSQPDQNEKEKSLDCMFEQPQNFPDLDTSRIVTNDPHIIETEFG